MSASPSAAPPVDAAVPAKGTQLSSSDASSSDTVIKVGQDIEYGDYPPTADEGAEFTKFYFFAAFFAAAAILPFAFLFLCCPQSCGIVGKRRNAFIWGATVGTVAAVGVVALHFFIGYGIFLAWWMSKYDYI